MSHRKPFIVGIGGTTRPASSSEQALVMALAKAREFGAETQLFGGKDLGLPLYDVDPVCMTDGARVLVEALRKADAVILSSPCYHGGVSGLVKNAIDFAEEMRNDPRVYFDGRAIGVIGCGYGYQGPVAVVSQLRQIAHALRGWPTPLGVAINSAVVKFTDGVCSEPSIDAQLGIMAGQTVDFAKAQIAKLEVGA
jgi:FMN reductase